MVEQHCITLSYGFGRDGRSQRVFMAKKKKQKTVPKKKKSIKKTKCSSKEKVCGEPRPVTGQPYKPPTLSYDNNGEVYPRLIFRPDSWWTRFKRFLGLIP